LETIPTIRVKDHHGSFVIRNADDLPYGEELFKADEFEAIVEHGMRLKLESSPIDAFFVAEANLWLAIKEKERLESDSASRSAREIETLAIAKEANLFAAEANEFARLQAAAAARSSRYAMYAAIIATTIMIIDNGDGIFSIIFILLDNFNNP